MWQTAFEWFNGLTRPAAPPRVWVGARAGADRLRPSTTPAGKLVVEIALGDEWAGAAADARLVCGTSPGHLREIVRFCSQQKLPVAVWLVTGVWRMPVRVEQVARWVNALARDAGEASVWIDTGRQGVGRANAGSPPGPMSAPYKRRLVGHLRRLGCQVH